MARKDHLITTQEDSKLNKKFASRNNVISFQAQQPTIAQQINSIGATSKTPDEVKDTSFPVLNPIDAIGKNLSALLDIDLSLENSPFHCLELSDVGDTITDLAIDFINLVKNKAERFILDITKDPANVSTPTITFDPPVENLPSGFPSADPRYLLEIVARETPTETRFEVVNRISGAGTIPVGTTENEHLEWDNTALTWNAVQASTYGATGPFADNGFLRFANEQIMLSGRNQGNTGNVELKSLASTPNGALDITDSGENTILLQLRAQDAINADVSMSFSQDPQVVLGEAPTLFTFPFTFEIARGADRMMAMTDADNVDFFEATDTFGFNKVTGGAINFGVVNAISFQPFGTPTFVGQSISRFGTGLHYDIEDTTHTHVFRVGGATPATIFTIANTGITLATGDLNMTNGDLLAVNNIDMDSATSLIEGVKTIEFFDDAPNKTIGSTTNALEFRIPVAEQYDFFVEGTIKFRIEQPMTGQPVRVQYFGGSLEDTGEIIFDSATDATILGTEAGLGMDNTNSRMIFNVPLNEGYRFSSNSTMLMEFVSGAWQYGDNVRVIFNPTATFTGLIVGSHTADPSTPADGGIFYNSTTDKFRFRENAAWVELGGAGVSFPLTPDINARGNVTGTVTVDLSLDTAHYQEMRLIGNITFVFSNPPADNIEISFVLDITQDGTGGRTVTWPASVRVDPVVGSGPNDRTVIVVTTVDNGTNYDALIVTGGTVGGTEVFTWTADHSAAGFDLNSLSNLVFQNSASVPLASERSIHYNDAEGMVFNVLTGDVFRFEEQGVVQITLSASALDLTPGAPKNILLSNNDEIRWAASTNRRIANSTSGFVFEVEATDTYSWEIAGTGLVMRLGTSALNLQNNDLILGTALIEFGSITEPAPSAGATIGNVFMDSGNSNHLSIRRNSATVDLEAGGGGEVFTWTADHDTGGNTLTFTNDTTPPADTIAKIWLENDDMTFNVSDLDTFRWEINGGLEMTLGASALNIQNNDLVLGTGSLEFSSGVTITQVTADIEYDVNAGNTHRWRESNITVMELFVNRLETEAIDIQMKSIVSPGVTGFATTGRIFMDSGNSNHLSIIRNASVIDLETGGGADTDLGNLVTTSINQDLIADVGGTRNLGSSALKWAGVFAGSFNLDTGQDFRANGVNSELRVNTGNDILFTEGSTTWLRMDGGTNSSTFTRDIHLTAGEAIRADSVTEIGYFVSNITTNPGAEGSIELPFTPTASPTDTQLNTAFGAFDGAHGMSGSAASIPILEVRLNGVWKHLPMSTSRASAFDYTITGGGTPDRILDTGATLAEVAETLATVIQDLQTLGFFS